MELFSFVKVSEHYPRILKPAVRVCTVTHTLDIQKNHAAYKW